MKYGYARVSTIGQDLDAQIEALENEGCNQIFSEKSLEQKRNVQNFKRSFPA